MRNYDKLRFIKLAKELTTPSSGDEVEIENSDFNGWRDDYEIARPNFILGGGAIGGLGGYGISSLLTKNKLLRLMSTLAGGAGGAYFLDSYANPEGQIREYLESQNRNKSTPQ